MPSPSPSRPSMGSAAGAGRRCGTRPASLVPVTPSRRQQLTRVLQESRRARVVDRTANDEAIRELDAEREPELEERAQDDRAARTLAGLTEHDQRAIVEIDAALARIDDGTYGTCEECGAEIPLERLRALPTARLCVDCQRAAEKRHAAAHPGQGTTTDVGIPGLAEEPEEP